MKILFHAHEFNIKEGGPCTKRINSIATYLSEKGYDVVILTSKHNQKTEMENLNKKYKIIYSYSTLDIKGSTLKRFLNNTIFGITSFFKALVKIKNIDVVVTTSPPPLISIFGFLIAKIKKAKLVYDVRDIWPDVALEMESFKKGSMYDKVFTFIANFMYEHSDVITTVSPGKVEKIKGYTNSNKVKYIANGFDDDFTKFDIDTSLIEKYKLNDYFTTVYIGNVGLAQNLDALVELAEKNKQNKDMQFLIFGEGAYKETIEKKINEMRLTNIKTAGRIDYSKVYTILNYSKVSFISLKNNNMTDSIPTKMFDALGIGCPVLLMAKGDACDILEKTYLGEYVEDTTDLIKKFNYMFNNYDDYITKKESAIKFIQENYSRKEIAKKFEIEVLENLEKENIDESISISN